MKRHFLTGLVGLLWVVMMAKTVLVLHSHDLSPSMHYYGIMLQNTWQAHFNIDLLVHSILFACWIYYRESSKTMGLLYGMAAIYCGAIFSFLYLLVVLMRHSSDTEILLEQT